MRWEWDEKKSLSNLQKHHISFELAARILEEDPNALSQLDDRFEEERWQTIGSLVQRNSVTIFVVHTLPQPDQGELSVGRIISARLATAKERRWYVQGEID